MAKEKLPGSASLYFFEQVYQVVRLIPPGRVTSYGSIAKYLGSGKSSRMVGWAMNACHHHPDIPAHRVVNRAGVLTGKAHFGADTMQQLLEAEGIVVENDKIRDFSSHFWDPVVELELYGNLVSSTGSFTGLSNVVSISS